MGRKQGPDDQTRIEDRIIALTRDGVVHGNRLRGAGIKQKAVDKSVERRLLRRIRRDVFVLAGCRLEGKTAERAALGISHAAALSHWSAAHEHGLIKVAPSHVHFVYPNLGHIEDTDWFRAHATRRLLADEVTTRNGRRVTTVPRTIRDICVFLPAEPEYDAQLTGLIETALRIKAATLASLKRAFARETAKPLKARLSRLLSRQFGGDRTELKSVGEDWVRGLCERLGLPTPLFNIWVNGFEADCYLPDRRLNLEFDGFAFHEHRTNHDGDRRRDRLLLAAGVNVGRLTDTDFESLGDVEREVRDLAALPAPAPAPGIRVATVSRHRPTRSPQLR